MFRPANRRRALAVVLRVGVPALACVVLAAGPQATQQAPAAQPAQDLPRPTFRLGASYVRVDVYPTRNGEPVQDLERADLELLEDGVPQRIEQFERVSLQTTLDRESRRDPNTVAESREQAADPRRRVFVVYLDTGMTTVEGSYAARRPIVDMLDRLIGDDDLYAVMTPDMGAKGITFARRTESLDAELAKYWTWGQRDALVRRDPEEIALETCFPDPAPEKYCRDHRGNLVKQPADAYRGVAAQLIERRSEQRALSALDDLVSELGALREERKAVIVVSQGWRLLEPKFTALTKLQECDQAPMPGMPGVSTGGRIVSDAGAARSGTGSMGNRSSGAGWPRTRSARRWPVSTLPLTMRRSFVNSSSAPTASTCRSIPSTPADSGCSTGRSVPATIASVATQASGRRTCGGAASEARSAVTWTAW